MARDGRSQKAQYPSIMECARNPIRDTRTVQGKFPDLGILGFLGFGFRVYGLENLGWRIFGAAGCRGLGFRAWGLRVRVMQVPDK